MEHETCVVEACAEEAGGARRAGRHPYADVPLVILAGRGRSGTTALRHALSLHPQIDPTGNENNIIEDVVQAVRWSLVWPDRRQNLRVSEAALLERTREFLLDVLWPVKGNAECKMQSEECGEG